MSRRNLERLSATENAFFDDLASCLISSSPLRRARSPTTEALPSVFSDLVAGALNVGQVPRELVQARGGERGGRLEQRRLLDGEVVELGHRRPQLGEEVVEQGEVLREVVAALGRGVGRARRLLDEADDVRAALVELADDLGRSSR